MRRNWQLVDQKSFDFVIIDSSLLFSRKDPKTNSNTLIQVFLSSLITVSFLSHLIDTYLGNLIEFHSKKLKDLLEHVNEFLAIILIPLLIKDNDVFETSPIQHLSLAISGKVSIFTQTDFLVISKKKITWTKKSSFTNQWSSLNGQLPLIHKFFGEFILLKSLNQILAFLKSQTCIRLDYLVNLFH